MMLVLAGQTDDLILIVYLISLLLIIILFAMSGCFHAARLGKVEERERESEAKLDQYEYMLLLQSALNIKKLSAN